MVLMNSSSTPLVSVLMTVYNREKYIAEAIDSVAASSYQHWELIIVDDGSEDKSLEIAKRYALKESRMKVFRNKENLGDYPNRNKAATFAKGKYLKYLDCDDVIYPHGLEIMVKAMEKFPDAGMGLSYQSHDNGEPLPVIMDPAESIKTHFFKKGILFTGPTGSIYRTEDFISMKGFSDYGPASDYDFHLRMATYKSVVFFGRDLFWWRPHDQQEIKVLEDQYLFQNDRIIRAFINSENLPLSPEEKNILIINYEKNLARKVFMSIIKLHFHKASVVHKTTNLRIRSYWFALLPSGLRKLFIQR